MVGGVECTRQFPSAEAVIEALSRETPPDAILLDIDMGGMSGLEALRPIKSLARWTPVLMLTAFYDPKRRSWAFRDGAADFLMKRFEVEEISKRIRDACRQPFDGGRMPEPDPEEMPEPEEALNNFTDWPERRAPVSMGQHHRGDDISEASTGRGRSNMRSRSVARGLARGVRYLRTLVGGIF